LGLRSKERCDRESRRDVLEKKGTTSASVVDKPSNFLDREALGGLALLYVTGREQWYIFISLSITRFNCSSDVIEIRS